MTLAVGDQQKRDDDLHDRHERDRAPAPGDGTQRAGAQRERDEHRGAEDDPREDDEDRRHPVVQRDLDEEIRGAP